MSSLVGAGSREQCEVVAFVSQVFAKNRKRSQCFAMIRVALISKLAKKDSRIFMFSMEAFRKSFQKGGGRAGGSELPSLPVAAQRGNGESQQPCATSIWSRFEAN